MPDYIGLYYPHIAFPDDTWMKTAALYWDKLGRIVPRGHYPQDSKTVCQLRDELGLVEDFMPLWEDTWRAGNIFEDLLMRHGKRLQQYYSVLKQNTPLGYIYSEAKMSYVISNALEELGLAVRRPSGRKPFEQLGMHQKLASIYMEVLASEMAAARRLSPVTDTVGNFVLSGGYTSEQIAEALLESDDKQPHLIANSLMNTTIEQHMAILSLETVIPQGIENIPVKKIIRFRKHYRQEMTAFQNQLNEFVKKLDTIQGVSDPVAIEAHFKVAYERDLEPQMKDIKQCWKSLAVETGKGIWSVQVALPPVVAGAGAAFHVAPVSPLVAGTTAVACSIVPVFLKKRAELSGQQRQSLATYLLYVQEELAPTNLVYRVTQGIRRVITGI